MSLDEPDRPLDDPRARAAAEARARLRGRGAGSPPTTAEPGAAPGRPGAAGDATCAGPGAAPAGPDAAEGATSARTAPAAGTATAAGTPAAAETPPAEPAPPADATAEAGTAEAGEAADAPPTGQQRALRGHPGRARVVAAVLAVVCAGLAAALVVTLLQLNHDDSLASARRSALAAARADAVDLSSYRYSDLAAATDRVLSRSTASFKKSYSSSSGGLDTILRRYKASAVGRVLDVGIQSASASRAVVLAFVNQTVTNTQQNKPTNNSSRLVITLVRQSGRWLIDKVVLE